MANLLASILNLETYQKALISLFLLILICFTIRQKFTINYPSNLPRVREKEGRTRFSLKTRLAYFTDCEALFKEAYNTVPLPSLLPHFP